MPRLSLMTVQNIRTHATYSLTFSPFTTAITGKNGVGKTSLLEAIYIVLQGRTFKTSDMDVLKKDADFFSILLRFDDATERSVVFQPANTQKKQFTINGKVVKRLTFHQKIPLVLFEPDDLRIINGSPSRRRITIDGMISRINPQYATYLHRYEKALQQRNTLLKQQGSHDSIFAWNITLSKYGYYVMAERQKYITAVNMLLAEKYQDISGVDDNVEIVYCLQNESVSSEQTFLLHLDNSYEKDCRYGYTSIGPHRDMIQFLFNTSLAETVCSRGESRSIVVAIKQIELLLIERLTGHLPLLLLDDVLSELDNDHQKKLTLSRDYQTIITSTTLPCKLLNTKIVELVH